MITIICKEFGASYIEDSDNPDVKVYVKDVTDIIEYFERKNKR